MNKYGVTRSVKTQELLITAFDPTERKAIQIKEINANYTTDRKKLEKIAAAMCKEKGLVYVAIDDITANATLYGMRLETFIANAQPIKSKEI